MTRGAMVQHTLMTARMRSAVLALSLCTFSAGAGDPPVGQYPQHVVPVAGDDAWHGRLRAISFAPVSGAAGTPAPADAWEADALLSGVPPHAPRVPSSRVLWTARDVAEHIGTGTPHVALRVDSLSHQQLAPFMQAPDGNVDNLHTARIAYLRGSRANEGMPGWRVRRGVLGAMRAATPRVIGAPSLLFLTGRQYAFARAHQLRTPLVIIGANDGMVHAFELASGIERFAYAPSALLPWLATVPHTQARPRSPVCPRPSAADVELEGIWRTVVVCSTGAHTAGVFVLDVTDPDVAHEHGLRWETDSTALPALGHTSGPAAIAGLPVSSQAGPANADGRRWFAIIGNGTAMPSGVPASDSTTEAGRQPTLLLLALDRRHGQPWQLGRNYWVLPTPPGAQGSLGAPAIATDMFGQPIAAYAGDNRGTLWRFDLRGALPWDDAARRVTPLLIGHSRSGKPLDLTATPLLLHSAHGTLVIATGVPDDGPDNALDGGSLFATLDDGSTRRREDLAAANVSAGVGGSMITPATSQTAGWSIDLPQLGERVEMLEAVGHGQIRMVTTSADGTARQYLLQGLNGKPVAASGVTGSPFDSSDSAMPVMNFYPAGTPQTSVVGTHDTPWQLQGWLPSRSSISPGGWQMTESLPITVRTGRLSWRELPVEAP